MSVPTKIDITSTAVEKSIDLVKGFIERIAGSSLDEAGLMLAENVRLRRLRNQIAIFQKAKQIADENNMDIKQINLKTLVPLLEFTSLEEDETLQEKWANLIANYVDARQQYESSVFPYILNQLSTKEALMMDQFHGKTRITNMELNMAGVDASNLVRLGLIEKYAPNKIYLYAEGESPKKTFKITKLGKSFVICCAPRPIVS